MARLLEHGALPEKTFLIKAMTKLINGSPPLALAVANKR